jgi:hypothetical protein
LGLVNAILLRYYTGILNNSMREVGAVKKNKGNIAVAAILSLMLFFTIGFCDVVLAQQKTDEEVCPKPYIKLIKPKLAKAGQQITIRGRRFGDQEKAGEVIFSPGISGNIVSWTNSRITVEVPAGAKTGAVVVQTKCAESNTEILKIEEEAGGEKK